MMTNHITNTLLTYQIDLPSLWNFPACWSSLCEEIVEDLNMACGYGNLLTLGCCTSWHQLAPAGPRWVKQPIKTLMDQLSIPFFKAEVATTSATTVMNRDISQKVSQEEGCQEVLPSLQQSPALPQQVHLQMVQHAGQSYHC